MKKLPVLNDLLQQVKTINEDEPDSATMIYWSRIAIDLVVADSQMWDWMHRFDPVMDTMTTQEAVGYLDKQYWILFELDQQFDSTINMTGKALEGRN